MNINCSYCRAANAVDNQRCQRCGRRLHVSPPQTIGGGAYGVSQAATARALRQAPAEPVESTDAFLAPGAEPEALPRRAVYQRSLFGPTSQVVPFESISPKAERPRARRETSRASVRGPIPGQQTLEFMAPAQPLDADQETRIYCDAPVAIVPHRMLAAAVDMSIIAIALGFFIAIVELMCGEITLAKETIPLFLAIAAVFALLYKVLWAFADADSPGMRFTRLRSVNFDGRRPNREQRVHRIASGCLSVAAAGLGVMWALVDEESLTWHDHISKTFPTPY
jgi:uncharacterized RDD family membrane protein YckC